jgi:hypothetical protein
MRPSMETPVIERNTLAYASGIVTKVTAMYSAVAQSSTVSILEGIDFAARRPADTVPDSHAKGPERWPDALEVITWLSELESCLHTHFLAWGCREGINGFKAAGSPLAACIFGDNEQSAGGSYLAVDARACVDLLLAVRWCAGPEGPIGGVYCRAAEGFGPGRREAYDLFWGFGKGGREQCYESRNGEQGIHVEVLTVYKYTIENICICTEKRKGEAGTCLRGKQKIYIRCQTSGAGARRR